MKINFAIVLHTHKNPQKTIIRAKVLNFSFSSDWSLLLLLIGESVSYTNWVPGRKSNFQSHDTEDCVVLIPYKQGMWDDIPCGSSSLFFGERGETHPYMCEFSK